jgi:hypothetical protein
MNGKFELNIRSSIETIRAGKEKAEYVKNKTFALYKVLNKVEMDKVDRSITSFMNMLKADYPDAENRLLFHALKGSTIDNTSKIIYEDFPDRDSVVLFIDNIAKRYSK